MQCNCNVTLRNRNFPLKAFNLNSERDIRKEGKAKEIMNYITFANFVYINR